MIARLALLLGETPSKTALLGLRVYRKLLERLTKIADIGDFSLLLFLAFYCLCLINPPVPIISKGLMQAFYRFATKKPLISKNV